MSSHFIEALRQWLPLRDAHAWVLGAVIQTRGSVYRKTGALMLLSDAGHQLGLLSGGCLEADLLLQARKVCALGKSRRLTYDATDEGSIAWQLGIGCGGAAEILLHPCSSANAYLQLDQALTKLEAGEAVCYQLHLNTPTAEVQLAAKALDQRQAGQLQQASVGQQLVTLINPPPGLLVLGSGVDMVPLCQLALNLGWQVHLADPRLSPQGRARFPAQVTLYQASAADLPTQMLARTDAVVVAHHNVALDAAAMMPLQASGASYIGLLGPASRKQEVLAKAGLVESELRIPISGPMGLALGGDLPESIALSVLAEAHAVLHGSTGLALSPAYAPAISVLKGAAPQDGEIPCGRQSAGGD